uniref:Uncharacterized protein n=1 Tax=Anguilla anguilla TaxID=7936 RepID=A0A0E9PZM6_ANGAN
MGDTCHYMTANYMNHFTFKGKLTVKCDDDL